ncbi:MAG: hypothetical protein WKF70_04950, partial [Chitinophagaceae bacterium]
SICFSVFDQQPVVLQKNGTEQVFHFEPLTHVQQPMIQKVAAYFSGIAPNPCTGDEGVAVMELMEALTG